MCWMGESGGGEMNETRECVYYGTENECLEASTNLNSDGRNGGINVQVMKRKVIACAYFELYSTDRHIRLSVHITLDKSNANLSTTTSSNTALARSQPVTDIQDRRPLFILHDRNHR